MKNSITRLSSLIAFLFISTSTFSLSINPTSEKEAYDHLYEINNEWIYHSENAPNKAIAFDSDIDRISYHIDLVEKSLRNNIPENITGRALENRLQLLTELDIYGEQKVFPTNVYHPERTPYFIDDYGVHCAVGYLIMKSGHSELSNRISDEHNHNYLKEINTPGIAKWAKEYGFELSELAWIQPGYSSPSTFSTLGGTNGEVTTMCKDYTNNRLIYAGDFTGIDGGTACSGIGYYQFGTMHCLGGGLDGTINHVYESQGAIYVSGLVNNGGTDYSQAIFSNGNWTYLNIPGLEGVEARTGMAGTVDYKRELVIMNDQGANDHEVWRLSNTDVWEKQATAYGQINSIALGDTHHAYGGQFTSLTLHLSGGDQTLNTINACLRENTGEVWSELTGQISDTVNVVKWLNGTFFFGGTVAQPPNFDTPFAPIAMLNSDTLAGLYGGIQVDLPGGYTEIVIRDIDAVSDERIVVCGNFFSGSIGYFGSNLGIVDYSNFSIWAGVPGPQTVETEAVGALTSINAAVIVQQTLFVGGAFVQAPTDLEPGPGPWSEPTLIFSDVHNLAKLDAALTVASKIPATFKVFPNPAKDALTIESNFELQTISILDMNGRLIILGDHSKTIDIRTLKRGSYFIKVETENSQMSHQKFIKQ